MSGELQTIPARHGVATFVPRGRTIKIINTYGKQVVSTWAFSLAKPPEEGEEEEVGEEEIEEKTKELEKEISKGDGKGKATEKEDQGDGKVSEEAKEQTEEDVEKPKAEAAKPESKGEGEASKVEGSEEAEDPPEEAPPTPPEKTTESTTGKKQPGKRTWASYLPSMPYRSKGAEKPDSKETKADKEAEKAQNEAASKKWSSYLPTGQSFSSYVPNVQLPDSKGVVSAFKSSHYRDPNKSYAEQLYDFSKTPVGAAGLSAASGSGYASSMYAAYSAYQKMGPHDSSLPPMEYLSLPHTRAASHRLVPEVDDTLLTNLRSPIMTLIEDTTPGGHDTLTSACDASLYSALGVDKPEEHGSCAENLVLALKELNEKAGLKGTKAVGADITVNIAPTPLHLFMNAPIEVDTSAQSEGAGARGAKLRVDEPKGKKRGYVRFRAERDIVIVMSACPMDLGKQNGGKCMAANYMVEEPSEEDMEKSTASLKKPKKKAPPKLGRGSSSQVNKGQKEPEKKGDGKDEKKDERKVEKDERKVEKKDEAKEDEKVEGKQEQKEEDKAPEKPKGMPRPRGGPAKIQGVQRSAAEARKGSTPAADTSKEEKKEKTDEGNAEKDDKKEEAKDKDSSTPKKKPKKLERRTGGAATPSAKSESS